MEAKQIKRYINRPIPWLIAKATEVFNAYIRKRDENEPCISCGSWSQRQAGHFYSGGHYPELRFNENNVNGQCLRCNLHLSGNLIEYRKNLIKKIGIEEVEKLDQIVAITRQTGYKWDKFRLIEIIITYSNK